MAIARRSDIAIPVLCDGTLEPEPGGELRAPDAATVDRVVVREGSRVATGDILVRLSAPELVRQARDARSEATALETERTALEPEIAALEAESNRRRATAEADARLLRAGAITEEVRDADTSAAADARARLAAARARLSALGTEDPSSRLALARRSAEDLEARVARLTVTAPISGLVYGLPRRTGERLQAGETVAAIADPARRRVRARVDEPDLPRVAPGQILTATFDGLPGREWRGKVSAVASTLRDEAGRRVGDVTGEIADPEGLLPGNASVNVSIVTAEHPSALVVPRAALQREGDRRFVFVFDGSRARRRDVSVGLLGATDAEITAGLAPGDRVVLPGSAPLADGARVSVAGGAS
jgi:HlyD family secretion protein